MSEIKRCRALLDGASPAPWQWLNSGGEPDECDELQDGNGEMVASGFRDDLGDNFAGQGGTALTDGRLCAAARNAMPTLLDAAEAVAEFRRLGSIFRTPSPIDLFAALDRLDGAA